MKSMGRMSGKAVFPFLVLSVSVALLPSAVWADWSGWWSTPEQRALKLYESGEHDALLESSPDDNWTALGQFQNEDYTAASASFAKSREALNAVDQSIAATTALYNQGVVDVLSGDYEQAIQHFDDVLSENPGFTDAEHNLEIAKQLLELQQNPENSQDQNGEQGEEGEEGDQNSESPESGQPSDDSEGESSESSNDDASEGESSSESDQESSSSSDDNSDEGESSSASEAQQQQEEREAREALAAEALQEQLNEGEESGQMMEQAIESEQPLTESEQATEQILRRIPDDPRGLLRRKLEQSHRNEFPEVRDAIEPW